MPPPSSAEPAPPEPRRLREIAHGGLRGAIAAMAMTGMRAFTVDLGIVEQTPPEAIFKQRARGLIRKVPRGRRRAAIELAHWGYGAAGGAAFAALPEALRRRPWAGPIYGIADLARVRGGAGSGAGALPGRQAAPAREDGPGCRPPPVRVCALGDATAATGVIAGLASQRVDDLLSLRSEANEIFFEEEAARLARCCHLMAERFARGGRLVALGRSPIARSDARHVAVEFVHPVIVGKRALPAIGLAPEGGRCRTRSTRSRRPTTSRSPTASTTTRPARHATRSRSAASGAA